MISPNVETFIGCDSSYRAADIVLYGAPFDSTTSYRPGARFGPSAIRHESFGLETYSPYQNADLTDFDVFDSGDLELCFGSSEAALADIEARAAEILHDGKFPLLLGGEHLVTLGAVRAMVEKYPDLHIVHFDAHADLRDDYLGAKLSHACVLRRCHDLIGDGRIHQFCIRSGDRTEFEFAAAHTEMHKFDFTGLAQLTEQLCASKVPVYLTIDLDCLDPSCFPGTGTPEAGGVSFLQLLEAIRTVTKANIVDGFVEYIPQKTKMEHANTVRVPLNQKALDILERYKNLENALLPRFAHFGYNKKIKEILKYVGIDRKVIVLDPKTREDVARPLYEVASTHTARKTFIGNLYRQVKDPNLIASMSGHSEGSRAFARYRKIDDEMKKELVNLLD